MSKAIQRRTEKLKSGQIVLAQGAYCYGLVALTSVLGAALIFLTLSGCSPAPRPLVLMQDYQARLARVQELEITPLQAPTPPRPPSVRELTRAQPELVSLSVLDAMRLDACEAGQLLAQRNSSLGKLGSGLLRYHQEIKLIEALQHCIQQAPDNGLSAAAQARLNDAIAAQQENLDALRQRAMATDDSLRHALSPGAEVLTAVENASLAPSVEALALVIQVLAYQPLAAEPRVQLPTETRLQDALQALEQSDYLPQLWRTLHDQRHWLEGLSPYVEKSPMHAACQNGQGSSKADILHTIFVKFYSGEIQPYLAQLSSQSYELQPLLGRLSELTQQPELKDHLDKLQNLPQTLTATTKVHAEYWQGFFKACGFQPG